MNRQKNIAPNEMNAPASIPATNMRESGMEPFDTPSASAFASVCAGLSASIEIVF